MKKFLSLFLLLSLILLTACTNNLADDTTTSENAETPISTETSETETTAMTRSLYETEVRETVSIQTEIPELQEKIDRNQEKSDYFTNKVILKIGEKRDVPYYGSRGSASYYSTHYNQDGGIISEEMTWSLPAYENFLAMEEYLPDYKANSEDTFSFYVNDISDDEAVIQVIKHNENGWGETIGTYRTLDELCEKLESGTYYAMIGARIEGNYLICDGVKIGTEYMDQQFYFILEVE